MSTSETLPPAAPASTARAARVTVRTLDRPAFDAACARLMQMASHDGAPDLLVGIRTGGLVVAESMASASPQRLPVLPLTSQRAGTGTKSQLRGLPAILRRMPRPVIDGMRLAEHHLVSKRRRRRQQQGQHIDPAEAEHIRHFLATAPRERSVLVVDDAVDSGVTLNAVLNRLRAICPGGTVFRSAVITVTLERPLTEPDYALYRGVLCRFPWSFDAAR